MKVKVTKIPGTYAVDGTNYGPFAASVEEPHTEVPEGLALALSLPIYDGEEPEPEEGADIQELLAAKAEWEKERDSLLIDTAAALDREKAVKAELESTQSDFIRYQNDLPGLKARVAELEAGAAAEPESGADDVAKRDNINPPAEPDAAKPAHVPKKASKA